MADRQVEKCAVCGNEFHIWAIAQICQRCLQDFPLCETDLRLQPSAAMIEAVAASQVERELAGVDSTTNSIVTFPRTVVEAGALETITIQPNETIKPRFLRVTQGSEAFVIKSIRAGNREQLTFPFDVSAEFFDCGKQVVPMRIDAMHPAMVFAMTVQNRTAAKAVFEALWEVQGLHDGV